MTTRQHTFLSRRLAGALLGGLALCASLAGGAAAEGQLRIAKQFGVVYLLLNVVEDQKLIEKHGQAAGLDIKVGHVQLSGGSAGFAGLVLVIVIGLVVENVVFATFERLTVRRRGMAR